MRIVNCKNITRVFYLRRSISSNPLYRFVFSRRIIGSEEKSSTSEWNGIKFQQRYNSHQRAHISRIKDNKNNTIQYFSFHICQRYPPLLIKKFEKNFHSENKKKNGRKTLSYIYLARIKTLPSSKVSFSPHLIGLKRPSTWRAERGGNERGEPVRKEAGRRRRRRRGVENLLVVGDPRL